MSWIEMFICLIVLLCFWIISNLLLRRVPFVVILTFLLYLDSNDSISSISSCNNGYPNTCRWI